MADTSTELYSNQRADTTEIERLKNLEKNFKDKLVEYNKSLKSDKEVLNAIRTNFKDLYNDTLRNFGLSEDSLTYGWWDTRQYPTTTMRGKNAKVEDSFILDSTKITGNVEKLFTGAVYGTGRIQKIQEKMTAEEESYRQKQIVAAQGILGRGSIKQASLSMFAKPSGTKDLFQDKGILQSTIPQNSLDLLG